jgi:hypothetical protein
MPAKRFSLWSGRPGAQLPYQSRRRRRRRPLGRTTPQTAVRAGPVTREERKMAMARKSWFRGLLKSPSKRSTHTGPKQKSRRTGRGPLELEALEDRTLLSISSTLPVWQERGPSPTFNGQTVGLGLPSGDSNPVSGAINAVAVNPNDPTNLYVATVNGGIWSTKGANLNWAPLTDRLPSLAVSTIAFSPLDTSGRTLFAGTGQRSSGNFFGASGGPAIGLLRTTDAGANWTVLGQGAFAGANINAVIPTSINTSTGQVVLVAARNGLFRSADGGNTFAAAPVLGGNVTALVVDPGNNDRFYAGVAGVGVFVSKAGTSGASWTAVNTGLTGLAGSIRIELAVGNYATANVVYAAIVNGGQTVSGVFRSTNQGGSWRAIQGNAQQPDTVPQGGTNGSIVADPTNSNVFYIAGDDQPTPPFIGRIFQVTVNDSNPAADSWLQVVRGGANGTAPHADNRSMVFDSKGDLLETDDGGIYKLVKPSSSSRAWLSLVGNLRNTEFYSVAYDTANHDVFGGAQDTGAPSQTGVNGKWTDAVQNDGNTVAIDNTNHIRYVLSDNLGGFLRQTYSVVGSANPGTLLSSQAIQLASATGAAALSGLNAQDQAFANGNAFSVVPYVLNAVNPSRILIGANGLYEDDQKPSPHGTGDVIKNISVPGQASGATVAYSALAYGGRQNGAANPEVVYASVNNRLFLRTSAGGSYTQLNYPAGAGTPLAIVLDPDNYQTAYVTDGTNIYQVTNAGNPKTAPAPETWAPITNNLGSIAGELGTFPVNIRSLELVKLGSTKVLLAGAFGGVYRLNLGVNPLSWSQFGTGLPDVQVNDIHYYAAGDVLVAGTYGRGAWALGNASRSLTSAAILTINGDIHSVNILGVPTPLPGVADNVRLVRDAVNPSLVDVSQNGGPVLQVELASLQQIQVNGLIDNQTLTVDATNGPIALAGTQSSSASIQQFPASVARAGKVPLTSAVFVN